MRFKFFVFAIPFIIVLMVVVMVLKLSGSKSVVSPLTSEVLSPTPKPLSKYTLAALRSTTVSESTLKLEEVKAEDSRFYAYTFSFTTGNKKATGWANIPRGRKNAPIIMLIRGFVDPSIYEPGVGTKRVGEALANAGYFTLAPDFLGYGGSDNPSSYPIEERFETYTTMLSLIAAIPSLPTALLTLPESETTADTSRVGIWGHSNGGHIALAILEITGKSYPTVLWAPVTKPFPYSILYYTDEYEDYGKKLRKLVADFENDYDADEYTITNYLDWINAPIQLHQGGSDDAVPQKWSDTFVNTLKKLGKEVNYFTYPGADHNLNPAWNLAVTRSISFYRKHFAF